MLVGTDPAAAAEHAIAAVQVRVDGAERLPGRRVGSEVDEVEIGVSVHEANQLAPGVTGGTEDGDGV